VKRRLSRQGKVEWFRGVRKDGWYVWRFGS